MNKLVLSFAIVALVSVAGNASAKQEIQKTVTVMELSDFPELQTKTKAVCASKSVMSVKLQTACKDDKFPSVTKAGAYRNVGIGAELNTLIRQAGGETAAKSDTK